MKAEINLSASNDDKALKIFQALDLNTFQWEREGMLHDRTTYELIKTDESTQNSTTLSSRGYITSK